MMPTISLSIKESEMHLPGPIHMESWFTRNGSNVIRTEVYQAYDGSVVAYQDCINGEWQPLYMEKNFIEQNKGEDDFESILKWTGVHNLSKIKTFNCGR